MFKIFNFKFSLNSVNCVMNDNYKISFFRSNWFCFDFFFTTVDLMFQNLDQAYFVLDLLQDIDAYQITYLGEGESPAKKKALLQIQRALLKTRELGDEKLQVVSHIIEHVENRTRQLEQDLENLGMSFSF